MSSGFNFSDLVSRKFQKICKELAEEKGFLVEEDSIPEMIALIHSEASEALESYRNKEDVSWTRDDGKPMGIASEFADIVIRVGHYAEVLGIDLQMEIFSKLEYNKTRSHKHGDKKC